MLVEIQDTRQIPNEPYRRWFRDQTFDLIVWYASDRQIVGFQLCYRQWPEEKALTWLANTGFSHSRIDDGEGRPDRHKMTPILIPDGIFEVDHVLKLFEKASTGIDREVSAWVARMIKNYRQHDHQLNSS
jgi:hypothetical protein